MPIAVQCPSCSTTHSAPDDLAGKRVKCPCGEVLQVPSAPPPPSAPATSQIECSACGRQHSVPPELAGKMAQCPCGAAIQVPGGETSSSAAAASPLDDILGGMPADPLASDPLSSTAGPLQQPRATTATRSANSASILNMVGAAAALVGLLLALIGTTMTWVTVDAKVNDGVNESQAESFQIRLGGMGTAVKQADTGTAIAEPLRLDADRPIGGIVLSIALLGCVAAIVWGLGFGPLRAQLSAPLQERIGVALAGGCLLLVVVYLAWIGKAVATSRAMHLAQHSADGFHTWNTAPGIGLYVGAAGALVALVVVSAVVRRVSESGMLLRLGELGGLLVGGLMVVLFVTPWEGRVVWAQLSLWETASGKIESAEETKERIAKLRADWESFRPSQTDREKQRAAIVEFLAKVKKFQNEYKAMPGEDARRAENFCDPLIETLNRPLIWEKIEPLAPGDFPGPVEGTPLSAGGLVLYEQRFGTDSWSRWRWKQMPSGVTVEASEVNFAAWLKWTERDEKNRQVNWSYDLVVHDVKTKRVVYATSTSGEFEVPPIVLIPGGQGAILEQKSGDDEIRKTLETGLATLLNGGSWPATSKTTRPKSGNAGGGSTETPAVKKPEPVAQTTQENPPTDKRPLANANAPQGSDILELVVPQRDAKNSTWRMSAGALVCDTRSAGNNVTLPVKEIPLEYDLEVTVQRQAGQRSGTENYDFILKLSTAQRSFLVVIEGWGANGNTPSTGLHKIDGKEALANESTVKGRVLTDGKPCVVLCKVRRGRVTLICDNKEVIDWTGEFTRLGSPIDSDQRKISLATRVATKVSSITLTPAASD